MADSVTYVYAVTRGPDPAVAHELQGIGGAPVRLVDAGGLAALASTVDAEEFGEEGLRRNLEDLRWLENTVRDHNRVVDAVAGTSAVAPLGLATVYYNDDRVRAVLAERAEMFTAALDQLDGRTEWGVKAYVDAPQRAEPAAPPDDSAESPGLAYLQRLRQRRDDQAQSKQESLRRAEAVHTALDELAEASRIHPPQNRELAGYQGLMVLNGAYLVDTARNEEFTAAVDDIAQRTEALRLEITGPWPAYSFATVHEEER